MAGSDRVASTVSLDVVLINQCHQSLSSTRFSCNTWRTLDSDNHTSVFFILFSSICLDNCRQRYRAPSSDFVRLDVLKERDAYCIVSDYLNSTIDILLVQP